MNVDLELNHEQCYEGDSDRMGNVLLGDLYSPSLTKLSTASFEVNHQYLRNDCDNLPPGSVRRMRTVFLKN